jgi:uncharacterized membrane protein (DUF485 family)
MTAYQMVAAGALIYLGFGLLAGFLVWVNTHRRGAAVVSGAVVGFVCVVIGFWMYYSFVLCPPGSGCV